MKNTNQNNKQNKRKTVISNYTKTFDNIQDAINGLKQQHEICNEIFPDEEYSLDKATTAVFNVFADNFPILEEKKNIYWTISVSSNKCSLKTDKGFGFSWVANYTIVDGVAKVDNIDVTISFFGKFDKDFVENCEWVPVVRNK